nr:Hg(II)-responsive transcriptional regulator [uncultured Cupriavidus sp.]
MASELTIGKLAEAANVHIETIRYYQRRGLLSEPPKGLGSHRRYSPDQVNRVRFIKRAQALGFKLDEIAALLSLDGAHDCADTRALADQKRTLIEQKLADLASMHQALTDLIQKCGEGDGATPCPIIQVLASD